MGFIAELQRRNVFRVAAAYIVTAWLLIQVVETIFPAFGFGDAAVRVLVLVAGIGFIPMVVFAWAFELTPEGLKLDKDVDRSQSITPHTGKKLDRIIMVTLAFALGYFAFDKFVLDPRREAVSELQKADEVAEARQEGRTEALVESYGDKSIAVLPFVNMSSDPEQEYFSDGISEEVLNLLAQVRPLRVAARTSAFSFKGKDVTVPQIGAALDVVHVLEGSVRKSGNRVRITAQLIDARSDTHLWSDTYDRELTDIFAIQDEIAGAILDQLKIHLLSDDAAVPASMRTEAEVYDLYLSARQLIYQRTRQSIEAAKELLDSAIRKDSSYAPAYAQRGIAFLLLSTTHYGKLSIERSQHLARQDLDKALMIDPDLAEAWAGMGLYHNGRPAESDLAVEALTRALAINPTLIDASQWLYFAYKQAGRSDLSVVLLESIVERDPLYRPVIANLINEYNVRGQQDLAFALLERLGRYPASDPNDLHALAQIHFSLGQFASGLPLAEEALRQQPEDFGFKIAFALGLLGTHQYERLTESSFRFLNVHALLRMGRVEEADAIAHELAAAGRIGFLFGLLNNTGRSAELVRYLGDRWPDLDAFRASHPQAVPPADPMLDVAYAYLETGDQKRFKDAISRVRAAHDQFTKEGIRSLGMDIAEAMYHAMTGDPDQAIARIGSAVDGGAIGDLRMSDGWPALKVLENDPRYRDIQSRMIANLNSQRAALGLEPAKI